MTFQAFNGVVDQSNGRVYAKTTDTWDDFATWDDYDIWSKTPVEMLYVPILPSINLGSISTTNITTNIQANGKVHYYFYCNDDSEWVIGDETSYTTVHVAPGDGAIASLSGRYINIVVGIEYDPTKGIQYFESLNFNLVSETKTLSFSDINSSTLSGTVSDRVFSIGTDVSGVKEVQVTSQGTPSPYNVDLYVSKNQTSSYTFPDVISKAAGGVHLQFIGIDGEPRDSVFDITLTVLPEWYMDVDGNLKER